MPEFLAIKNGYHHVECIGFISTLTFGVTFLLIHVDVVCTIMARECLFMCKLTQLIFTKACSTVR